MDEKIQLYSSLQKESLEIQKAQKEKKKLLKTLHKEIECYMKDHDINVLQIPDGEIKLCDKKVNQTFKLQSIKNKLVQKLKCKEEEISELAESLVSEKVFTTEQCVKINFFK